ncbi:MAG TPA: CHAT domain-containing protein [Planctomycetota bacterium]
MATNPDRGLRDRRERPGGPGRRGAGLALALILGAAPAQDEPAGAAPAQELAALDLERLSVDAVLELALQRHLEQGDPVGALEVLEGKIEVLEQAGTEDLGNLAVLHFHAADVQRALRRFEAALASLRESEELLDLFLATSTDQPKTNWARTLRTGFIGLRGWIHQDLGALEAAAQAFEDEQVQIAALRRDGVDVRRAQANSDRHLANFAMLTGFPRRIEERLESTELPPPTDAELPYLRLRWAGAVREEARRAGADMAEARVALELALAEPELAPIDRVSGEVWLANLELDEGRPARARELWAAAGERLHALQGAAGTRRRWVGLGARLAETPAELARARTEVAAEIEAFLAEWRRLEPDEGGYGLFQYDDALALYCELTRLALALDGPELGPRRALEALARVHAETALARRLAAPVPTPEELRAALCARDGEGLLVYLMGPARAWVFALDAHGLVLAPLASTFALEGPRQRLVREILAGAGRWTEAGQAAAGELSRLLLPPEVRARIEGWDALAVAGLDLLLGDVPFELLDLGAGQRLGSEKAVWHLPSLATGVVLARRAAARPPGEPGVRLVGAPVLPAGMEAEVAPFELSSGEVERLLAAFPAARRDVHLGPAASGRALGEPEVAVLQILAHGRFDERRGRSAELLLAPTGADDDGRLSFADVERTWSARPAPRLVVLSACRAGRGVARRGDAGAASLATAFLARGSDAVLASAYDLDLDVALALSAAFHDGLARGLDAAEALRRARAELARSPELAESLQPHLVRAIGFAPAPFEPWLALEPDPRRPSPTWIAVGAGLVLALALWRVRRRSGR